MNSIKTSNLSLAFTVFRHSQGKRAPHRYNPFLPTDGDNDITKAQWDAISFNPVERNILDYWGESRLYGVVDTHPNVIAKPTWEQLIGAFLTHTAENSVAATLRNISDHADPIASSPVLHEDTGQNIQFKSIDSLTGLVHLHVKHSQEGETFEEVHFPSADNPKTTVALTTLAQLEGFLTAIATNKNRAESARNCVSADLHSLLEQIQTDGIADAERERLAGEITAITDDPGAAILAKVEDMYGAPPTIP